MSTAAILIVVAAVVGVEGDSATIDRGLIHGLEPGDEGSIFYELTVNGVPKRIEVGGGRVVSVSEETATLLGSPELTLRPGYAVELRIPGERLAPENLLLRARRYLSETRYRAVAVDLAAIFAGEALGDAEASGAGKTVATAPVPQPSDSLPQTPPEDPLRGMIRIPAGRYAIGLDSEEAEFYNQQPRFELELAPFWIDRRPVKEQEAARGSGSGAEASTPEFLRDLTWSEASENCRSVGKRLPTEFEWEIAAQLSELETRPGLLEWTATWYQPYPDNRRPESAYGETFRVLRGSTEGEELSPHIRRFMRPDLVSPRVGFRCARSVE